jgi:7-cyano-7-deazaguanine synthase in queuosine biosynthesis
MIQIDNISIPFNIGWKKIAVSLSGGADSALLLYILCSNIIGDDTEIYCLSNIRMWKTKPWQEYDSTAVFNWMKDKFPNITFYRKTNLIAPELEYGSQGPKLVDEYGKLVSGDNIQIRSFAEYICAKEDIKVHYNAVTRNPKNVDFFGMPERDIDPTDQNKHLEIMEHMGVLACHPFRFIEKSWVVSQYKKFKIMNLFDLTRSCEGEIEGIDYKTYTPGQYVPTCGTCFWCKERAWALEKNCRETYGN